MVGAAAQSTAYFSARTQPGSVLRIQQLGFGAGEQVDIATDDARTRRVGLHKVHAVRSPVSNTRRANSRLRLVSALTASPYGQSQVIYSRHH